MNEFHQFRACTLQGEDIHLKRFAGDVVLVVNTASKCGLTPQYAGLESLYEKYKDDGLVILGFPCNQFGNQESGSAEQIEEFCQVNYGVSFPMFAKIEVNGPNTHPVFRFLKAKLGGFAGSRIKWNFTKFVIDRNGTPVKRFSPVTKPEEMENLLQQLL